MKTILLIDDEPAVADVAVFALREAGFDLAYAGNFVDQGFFATQQECNDCIWIFDGDLAEHSMAYVAEQAPDVPALASGSPLMFAHVGMSNIRSMLLGAFLVLVGISALLAIALDREKNNPKLLL